MSTSTTTTTSRRAPGNLELMRLLAGAGVFCCALAWVALGSAAGITKTGTTHTYRLMLTVGPREAMYTAAQVRAEHPATGEVMVGAATDMGGGHAMSMEGGMTRHLEVHVRLRSSGKVAAGVVPKITLVDESSKSMTSTPLHVMAMQGIGEGRPDLHYGNNVALSENHAYKVLVTLRGERAEFSFRAS
jgi:hypothetical protein